MPSTINKKGKLGIGVTFEFPLGGAAYYCDETEIAKNVTCPTCNGEGRRFYTYPPNTSIMCGNCYGNKTVTELDKTVFRVNEITIESITATISEGKIYVSYYASEYGNRDFNEYIDSTTCKTDTHLFKTEEAAIANGVAKGWHYDPKNPAFKSDE